MQHETARTWVRILALIVIAGLGLMSVATAATVLAPTPPSGVSPLTPVAPPRISPDKLRQIVGTPAVPELIEPVNVTIPLGTGVVFAWKPVNGAVRYSLKVSSAPNMTYLVTGAPIETDKTYHALTSQYLRTGVTYYWQVGSIGVTQTYPSAYGPATPAAFTVAVPAPTGPPQGTSDLVMTACFFSPQTIVQGDALNMTVRWKNIGAGPALVPANAYEWTMTGVGGGANNSVAYTIPPSGEKFGGLNVTRDVGMKAPGTYTFTATVDPNNSVGETNENNNTCTCQVTILPRTTYPDLVITNLVLDPANPTSSAGFRLLVTVKNQGNAIARLFQGSAVVGGDPYAVSAAEPYETTLAVGASKTYALTPTTGGSLPGTRTWTIVLDPNNRVPESNEGNNQTTITFTVK